MDLPWDGAAKLLSAGPLGLGAILVLVTGWILAQGQSIAKGRLVLALGMLVSGVVLTLAGFGVLYLQIQSESRTTEIAAKTAADNLRAAEAQKVAAAKHNIHFTVMPLELGSAPTLPPPIIKINGKILDSPPVYTIESEVTVIVDVSDAIDLTQQYRTALTDLQRATDTAAANNRKIPGLLLSSCPGDSRNADPTNINEVVFLNSETIRTLDKAKLYTENLLSNAVDMKQ